MLRRLLRLTLATATFAIATVFTLPDVASAHPPPCYACSQGCSIATQEIACENSRVVVLEFGDYECPFCRNMETTLTRLRQEFPLDLAVAYRPFPLAMHQHAYLAARLAECAAAQGSFRTVHELLYRVDDLSTLTSDAVADSANIGEKTVFHDCAESEAKEARVEAGIEAATTLGLTSTPSLFVNGKLVKPTPTPVELEQIVREALASG